MNLRIGIQRYRVAVCPGPLLRDGERRGAVVHGRDLLIAGDVDPRDRLVVLLDQARMLWECQLGTPLASTTFATYAADLHRQLSRYGGEAALLAMNAPTAGADEGGRAVKVVIGPATYRVVIVKGQLRLDGERVAGLTHRREIHVSGEVAPDERLEVVVDQCRRLWRGHFGAIDPNGFGSFFTMLSRQIERQGGERALRAMKPAEVPPAPDATQQRNAA